VHALALGEEPSSGFSWATFSGKANVYSSATDSTEGNYTFIVYFAVDALWALGRADHAGLLERNLRDKTLAGDFRYPACDARLALARLCALTGRAEEAEGWFERARAVLDEQGARPLRAVADLDQALMYVRRGDAGDRARALALLQRAIPRMRELEMTGWLRQAQALAQ